MTRFNEKTSLLVSALISVVVVAVCVSNHIVSNAHGAQSAAGAPADRVATLEAEVARLKSIGTDQSHVMADVGYHFANLWFAGDAKNWALAKFYFDETRSHLNWAVRVIPVRKDRRAGRST